MVALCIANQDEFEILPVFVIVDAFNGARKVVAKLTSEFTELQKPAYFPSRQSALAFLKNQKFDNLFIDSDVGIRNFLTLASFKLNNPNISINVYEEGLGTYRTDLYSGVKKNMFGLIGVGSSFGTCCFVTRIYVFRTKEYSDKIPGGGFKVRKIQGDLSQFLMINRDAFKRLFEFKGIKPSSPDVLCCSLYLSGWNIGEEFLQYFRGLEGDLFMKLHPRIRDNLEIEGIQTVDARVPAELLLIDLIESYQFVQVYDHNSSIRRYVNSCNIKFNLADASLNMEEDVFL